MQIQNAAVTGSFSYNGVDISSITSSTSNISALNAITASLLSTTASLNTASGSAITRLNSIESTTGSLNTASGSAITRLNAIEVVTGSNISRLNSIELTTGSLNTASGSAITRLNALEVTSGSNITRISALETASGSAITRLSSLESKTGSYATTGSNTFVSTQYISASNNPVGFTTTASLYTDGGLRVTRDAYISGTLYLNNVTVYGTQSIAYISSSQLNIASNLITVNTATPSVQFGGLAVYDSGSTGLTGSILWDSTNNRWIYSNPSGSSYDGGMLISGPRNSSGLGNEVGTTACRLMVGQGGDHITSSQIYHDTTVTCIPTPIIGGSTACIGGTTTIASNLNVGNTSICPSITFTGANVGGFTNGYIGWGTCNQVTPGLYLNSPGTNVEVTTGYNEKVVLSTGAGFQVYTNNGAGTYTSRMLLDRSGNTCFSGNACAANIISTGTICTTGDGKNLDIGGVAVIRGNGGACTTHYFTTGAANVAKYLQYNATGTAINVIAADAVSYFNSGCTLLIGTTNTDIGGSVTGVGITANGRVLASISDTGALCHIFMGDRRGTSNEGPVLMLMRGGFYKSAIGVVGTAGTSNDGGITFSTVCGNDTIVERMRLTSTGQLCAGCIDAICGTSRFCRINQVAGNNTLMQQIIGAGTGYTYAYWGNNCGALIYGVDWSTGGALGTNSLAYSSGIYTATPTALHLGTNQVVGLTIDCNNKVGIGTTSPLNRLHIDGGSGIRVSDPTGANFRGIVFGATPADSTEYSYIKWNPNSGEFRIYANTAGFGGFTTFYSNNNEVLRITSTGIACFACQICTPAIYPGFVYTCTTTALNTSLSNTTLTVNQRYGDVTGGGDYQGGGIALMQNNGSDATWAGGVITATVGTTACTGGYPGGLAFWVKNANGATGTSGINQAMRIDWSGRVGIGTTTPAQKLSVNGTLSFRCMSQHPSGNWYKIPFSASKNTNSGTATTICFVNITDQPDGFNEYFISIEYASRLQGVSDSQTQVSNRMYGVNRFNFGTIAITDSYILAGGSGCTINTHAPITAAVVGTCTVVVKVDFSSSVSYSSFVWGEIKIYSIENLNNYLTIPYNEW